MVHRVHQGTQGQAVGMDVGTAEAVVLGERVLVADTEVLVAHPVVVEQVAVEVVTVLEKMGDWVDVVKSESIAGEESWVDTH